MIILFKFFHLLAEKSLCLAEKEKQRLLFWGSRLAIPLPGTGSHRYEHSSPPPQSRLMFRWRAHWGKSLLSFQLPTPCTPSGRVGQALHQPEAESHFLFAVPKPSPQQKPLLPYCPAPDEHLCVPVSAAPSWILSCIATAQSYLPDYNHAPHHCLHLRIHQLWHHVFRALQPSKHHVFRALHRSLALKVSQTDQASRICPWGLGVSIICSEHCNPASIMSSERCSSTSIMSSEPWGSRMSHFCFMSSRSSEMNRPLFQFLVKDSAADLLDSVMGGI
ncbi:hypothetical protein CRENBAI_005077 [Crenichthys baileyi]|uniref:Uncharacterized protein n=1 Tax=Crenichthys baileyi TaxID=28760 RepID=A0AAV9SLP2_9TELE